MSDLTDKEQTAVRRALHVLRLRVGAWAPLARALRYQPDSLHKIAMARRAVTPVLALRIARFAQVAVDELLGGQWIPADTCSHCGQQPNARVAIDRSSARPTAPSELTVAEQLAVRTALRFLRRRVGGWEPLGRELACDDGAIRKVAVGMRVVTAALALRVARLAEVPVEELLAGQWLSARVCPHCGHPPSDFGDEDTVVV